MGADAARGVYASLGCGDEGALGWRGTESVDGIFEEIRHGLEVTGREGNDGRDIPGLVGEAVSIEVGTYGLAGVAADDGGRSPGVTAGGEGLVHIGGGAGSADGTDFDAGELGVKPGGQGGADGDGLGDDLDGIAYGGDSRGQGRFGARSRAELIGGVRGHGGGQVADRAVEVEDEVPGLAEDLIECPSACVVPTLITEDRGKRMTVTTSRLG